MNSEDIYGQILLHLRKLTDLQHVRCVCRAWNVWSHAKYDKVKCARQHEERFWRIHSGYNPTYLVISTERYIDDGRANLIPATYFIAQNEKLIRYLIQKDDVAGLNKIKNRGAISPKIYAWTSCNLSSNIFLWARANGIIFRWFSPICWRCSPVNQQLFDQYVKENESRDRWTIAKCIIVSFASSNLIAFTSPKSNLMAGIIVSLASSLLLYFGVIIYRD